MQSYGTPFDDSVIIQTLGKTARLTPRTLPVGWRAANALLPNSIKPTILYLASSKNDTGYQNIIAKNRPYGAFADGIVLTKKDSGVVMQTADCPIVIVRNNTTGIVVVVHAGRPALTPQQTDSGDLQNIVTKACLIAKGADPVAKLSAHITSNICGHCFVHNETNSESFIAAFDQFPPWVFTNRLKGALDMRAVILHQLHGSGIPAERITWDHYCTMETSWLSSHRLKDVTRNTIIVIRKK